MAWSRFWDDILLTLSRAETPFDPVHDREWPAGDAPRRANLQTRAALRQPRVIPAERTQYFSNQWRRIVACGLNQTDGLWDTNLSAEDQAKISAEERARVHRLLRECPISVEPTWRAHVPPWSDPASAASIAAKQRVFRAESGLDRLTCMSCCAQFVVHRNRILAQPKELYQALYDLFLGRPPSWNGAEFAWHVIFGELPQTTKLRHDAYMPRKYRP